MSRTNLEEFLQACHAPARLELKATNSEGRQAGTLSAPHPFALLGRDPANDLCLDDSSVSQRHAYVQVIGGRLFCVDLGSRTGICCAGVQGTSGWLNPGQSLEIGPFAIRYRGDSGEGLSALLGVNPLESRGTDPQLLPPMSVEFANGLTRQPRWRLSRVLTLAGRAPACKLQLADATVSRYHCALLGTPYGLWVIDLLGKDGTRVNGERVRWAQLDDGDRLQLGKFLIRVWREGPAPGSNATVVVSGATAGRPPAAGLAEVAVPVESPLAPLIGQFQRLQQRGLDEFHQTMLLVLQMFNVLQRERLDPLRDDLDQVYKLTLELQNAHAPHDAPAEGTAAATSLHESHSEIGSPQWIAELQRERQSHWHKVLAAVAGEPSA